MPSKLWSTREQHFYKVTDDIKSIYYKLRKWMTLLLMTSWLWRIAGWTCVMCQRHRGVVTAVVSHLNVDFQDYAIKVIVGCFGHCSGAVQRILDRVCSRCKLTQAKYISIQRCVSSSVHRNVSFRFQPFPNTRLIRELRRGRRQRRLLKTMIWLVKWGKIIVLHVRHALKQNSLT